MSAGEAAERFSAEDPIQAQAQQPAPTGLPVAPALAVSALTAPEALPIQAAPAQALPQIRAMAGAGDGDAVKRRAGKAEVSADWMWEKRPDEDREAGLVKVERKQEKEIPLHAHQALPVFDYLPHRFDPEEASEFMSSDLELSDGRRWTGRDLIALLVTPGAVPLDDAINPDHMDMGLYGKSMEQLRAVAEKHDVAPNAFHRALDQAFRLGLVYHVFARESNRSYYGVPERVRDFFKLPVPEEPAAESRDLAAESARLKKAFSASLLDLARKVEGLPARDEVFEYTAQLAAAARDRRLKLIAKADLPAAFLAKSDAIGFDDPDLDAALFTLLEAAKGTEWERPAAAVCEAALEAGLVRRVDERELRSRLGGS